MTEALQVVVYQATSLLLWPVVVLLLFAVGHAAFLTGEMLWEAAARRRGGARGGEGRARFAALRAADPGASPWLALDRAEAALAARIDRARLWARIGPALGLAGTLIPLGPALTALAAGDLGALAQGLVLAFGTTVLGIVAGSLGWWVATTWERWYRLDLAEVRHGLEAASEAPP